MKNVYDIKQEKNLNFILSLQETNGMIQETLYKKTVVVIHLHYIETIETYMEYVRNIPKLIDIIFTVSEKTVKERMLEYVGEIKNHYIIIEKNNRGRDISALLVAARSYIQEYEYFGFLHDKRPQVPKLELEVKNWIQCLWENMLGSKAYIDNVLKVFVKQKTVGVLAVPLPMSPNFNTVVATGWGADFENTKALAEKLDLVCDLDENKPVLTLGTVFWAKTEALKKLLDMEWRYEDFDEEPLAFDGTISHAIERCFAYVAQDAGYETGTVMTDRFAGERMNYMQEVLQETFVHLRMTMNIGNIAEMEKYDRIKKEIEDKVSSDTNIYLYGAGVYGKRYADWIMSYSYHVKAFLVTSVTGNEQPYKGIPVIAFEQAELKKNDIVIIAVNEKYLQEILEEIEQKKCRAEIFTM